MAIIENPLKKLYPELGDEAETFVPHEPILLGYRGSIAHGMYVPPEQKDSIDDVDLLAVYIPNLGRYFGSQSTFRGVDRKHGRLDLAAYELRHFSSLLENSNPNVMSFLWMEEKHYIYQSIEGRALRKSRDLFSSRRAALSFGGYAYSQLKRMTAYHDTGEDACCKGETFHLPDCPLTLERGRGSQKKFATGQLGAKRKALVEKHGYDAKNAAHLIRLLRMGIEFLRDGVMRVDRTGIDAEELLKIKAGAWEVERVKLEADSLFAELDGAHAHSPLPFAPNHDAIEKLCVEILSYHHQRGVEIAAADFYGKYGPNPWDQR